MKPRNSNSYRSISHWLFACCVLVLLMVLLGGLTRLTHSGLSITEWKPVVGTVPPLSENSWRAEFEKYQKIPEYIQLNHGMSLEEFKVLYAWEYTHRLLGRIAGIVFFFPFMVFLWRRKLAKGEAWKLAGIFVLGGLQGAVGWYMVKSGLSVRTDVSQYRLTLHLLMALLVCALLFLQGLNFWFKDKNEDTEIKKIDIHKLKYFLKVSYLLTALVIIQIGFGGFMAGLDAGLTYNTWPLMDGRFVPRDLLQVSPWYMNFFENIAAVQFTHRTLAMVVVAVVLWLSIGLKKSGKQPFGKVSTLLIVVVLLQFFLGVATLLLAVPTALASLHQLVAVWLLGTSLFINHRLCAMTRL